MPSFWAAAAHGVRCTRPYHRLRDFFISQGVTPDLRFRDLPHFPAILVSADLNSHQPVYHGSDPQDFVLEGMNIDLLAFAGHKGVYAPHGTGGLVVRSGISLETWVEGGSGVESAPATMPDALPQRLEAGTQNAAGF